MINHIMYLHPALSFLSDIKEGNEEWKKRISKEWNESRKLPRKQKKQKRKELTLDWSIANWDPFEDMS